MLAIAGVLNGVASMRWRAAAAVALVAATAVLVAACGGGAGGSDDALSGTVAVDGSSTVFPITEAVAEEFQIAHRNVRVTVGVSGTGGGFKKFCTGETDVSDASRPIKLSERALCEQNGVEWIDLTVALDGLAVVANPGLDFLQCITVDELAAIWAPGSRVSRWSDVRAGWPDSKIELFGPDVDSGTFDYFTEVINGEDGASRADYTASANDNVLVTGIAGQDGGFGYFGYAYYAENRDRLRVVAVDGGAGCVTPSDATVSDGSYAPLSRPLFVYVNTSSLEQRAVREFMRFYLSDAALTLVGDVGYTSLASTAIERSRAALESAIGGE